jgi:hypothetical protein
MILHEFLSLWFFQKVHNKSPDRPLPLASGETAQENGHAHEVFETSEHDAMH